MQLRGTGTGQDGVRWPATLVSRIRYLAGTVATADFPPTDQQREVQRVLEQRLEQVQQELQALLDNDVPAFNRLLRERNIAVRRTDDDPRVRTEDVDPAQVEINRALGAQGELVDSNIGPRLELFVSDGIERNLGQCTARLKRNNAQRRFQRNGRLRGDNVYR